MRGSNDLNMVQVNYDQQRYLEANKDKDIRTRFYNIPKQKLYYKEVEIPNNRGFEDKNLVKEHNDKLRHNKAFTNLEQHQLKKHSNY